MSKKVIGILGFLVIIVGILGTYCFNLNREIVALTELQKEASHQIISMQGNINIMDAEMASLNKEVTSRMMNVEDKISTLSSKIEDIAVISTERLYEEVKSGVVEVITEAGGTKQITASGFIFDPRGYVVTAYHVVEEATKVDVILYDGTISAASVTGYCPFSDIAVLTLEQALTTNALTVGDSNAIAIGEPVIAIGSPFELSGTVTSGIVSQKDRFVDIEYDTGKHRWVANLIQCDATVNFGNSGGPLINSKGEVIGLTMARVDPGEGDGIYYSVSSNKLKRVALSLIDHGFFDYPWLGVKLTNLTPQEARARQLDTINGTRVTEAIAGNPAALAGITADDIIVAIDGIPVREVADLTSYLGENKSPDETAMLTIMRDGETREIAVKLGKRAS